jgi:hypothetical protein
MGAREIGSWLHVPWRLITQSHKTTTTCVPARAAEVSCRAHTITGC